MKYSKKMKYIYLVITCTVMALGLSSCAIFSKPDDRSYITLLDEQGYNDRVLQSDGTSLVLFCDKNDAASIKMLRAYDVFARNYSGFASFYRMDWQTGRDGEKYGLETLPTMILIKNGIEIDRMRGVPSGKESLGFSDDLDLWMLKNVVEVKSDIYSGSFSYLFKNTSRLHIGSY